MAVIVITDDLTRIYNKWSRGESNSRPLHCERSALPTELRPHSSSNELVPEKIRQCRELVQRFGYSTAHADLVLDASCLVEF